jgi:hypothetical protein
MSNHSPQILKYLLCGILQKNVWQNLLNTVWKCGMNRDYWTSPMKNYSLSSLTLPSSGKSQFHFFVQLLQHSFGPYKFGTLNLATSNYFPFNCELNKIVNTCLFYICINYVFSFKNIKYPSRLGCSSVIEHLPSMCKALVWSLALLKKKYHPKLYPSRDKRTHQRICVTLPAPTSYIMWR